MCMRDCRKFRMKIEFVVNSKGSKVIGLVVLVKIE